MKLAIVYSVLAIIASLVNIATQDFTIHLYAGPHGILSAMITGTATGLIVKYLLDKRFIFSFRAKNAAHDSKTFLLYTLMGVATTLIFWGCELGFDWLFKNREMRYCGGLLGLAIGYYTKYRLDKRFVFKTASP